MAKDDPAESSQELPALYQLSKRVYTPAEIAEIAICSAGFIRKEIRAGRLRAHRLGGKLLRILREDAEQWLRAKPIQSGSSSSDGSPPQAPSSPGASTSPNGGRVSSVADIALRSVLNDNRSKPRPN